MNFLKVVQDCWTRGFDYKSYLLYIEVLIKQEHTCPHIVSETVYDMIGDALHTDMVEHLVVQDDEMDPVEAAEASLRSQGIPV